MAAEKILHGRSCAPIRNKRNRDSCGLLKQKAADMSGRPDTCGTDNGFVHSQPGHELIEIFRWNCLFRDDQLWAAWQQNHRLQILEQVVMKIIDRTVKYVGAPIADPDGVTVGRGANDTF